LKPFLGGRKIALIDDADYLHAESANCLLKTLEEPPPQTVIVLIGTSPARQLPTIRSRCQLVRFQPLTPEMVEQILLQEGVVSEPGQARQLALLSEGSLEQARQLADAQLWAFRKTLWTALSQPRMDPLQVAEQVAGQVESAGAEAAARRQRLRVIVSMAAEYYRQVLYYHAAGDRYASAGTARFSHAGSFQDSHAEPERKEPKAEPPKPPRFKAGVSQASEAQRFITMPPETDMPLLGPPGFPMPGPFRIPMPNPSGRRPRPSPPNHPASKQEFLRPPKPRGFSIRQNSRPLPPGAEA